MALLGFIFLFFLTNFNSSKKYIFYDLSETKETNLQLKSNQKIIVIINVNIEV